MSKNLRKITIAITPQTLYHLKNMANACGHGSIGRVVDKLVREHQTAANIRTTPNEREGFYYVRK